MGNVYEAVWAFEEDTLGLRKSLGEEFEAHTSQPLGIPLHKYEGQLTIESEGIAFVGTGKDAHEDGRLFVFFKNISDLYLGWDDVVRRWTETRALIKPLKLTIENEEKKTLYIYAKKVGSKIYGKENKALYEKLKTLRFR
jgi:hypothetical protein